ncbi:MAG: Asparagine synthetase (glutamine-hydrolyzing) [Nitrospira sp.]|nr:MAG: Asparagine synthetase (glutamine-hydrolyzing) [Nitrospira sp.]
MCGIAGTVGYDPALLSGMLNRLQHRGPDNSGSARIPGAQCALGHTRLSIIDLDPRSHQPFVSPCGRYVMVFNGEIYNFTALRQTLEQSGIRFQTTSDTEVLLHWFIERGIAGLPDLDGMYAFGFVDIVARTLLLARDAIGEKPLYFSETLASGRSQFAFASEIKALRELPHVDRSLNRTALLDFMRFLYTAPPHTLYTGIQELLPGHWLQVDLATGRSQPPQAFYSLEASLSYDETATPQSAAEAFRILFEDSVGLRLVSDAEIGIFLSAGIDSNAILAAAQSSSRLKGLYTYTLQYASGHDESALAREIATTNRLPNETILFDKLEFHPALRRVVDIFDQPFGNATALVSDRIAQQASHTCKVCLVGDGGDELAIGYPRYRAIDHFQTLSSLPRPLTRLLRNLAHWIPERGRYAIPIRRAKQFLHTVGQPLAESFLDWSTYLDTPTLAWATGTKECRTEFYMELIATFLRQQQDPIRAAAIVDLKSFVPYNLLQSADRTSMAHSIELRSPFLSPRLIRGISGLPSRVRMSQQTKPLITTAFADRLPAAILNQPKHPFNPPIGTLLRANLDELDRYLTAPSARIGALLDPAFVRREVADFAAQRRDNSTFLWGLATLEHWLQEGD